MRKFLWSILAVAAMTAELGTQANLDTSPANILAIFPCDSKSHFSLGEVIFTELASRGHKVRFLALIRFLI